MISNRETRVKMLTLRAMLTRILAGLGSVLVLFVTAFLYWVIADMVKGRATGRGIFLLYQEKIITSPVFWLIAVVVSLITAVLAKL